MGDGLGSQGTTVRIGPPTFVDRLAGVKREPGAHSVQVAISWQPSECALGCVQRTIAVLDAPQGAAAGSGFPQRATAAPWPASVAAAALRGGCQGGMKSVAMLPRLRWPGVWNAPAWRGKAPVLRARLRGRYTQKPLVCSESFFFCAHQISGGDSLRSIAAARSSRLISAPVLVE